MAELSFFVLSICATVFVAFFFAAVSRATGGRAKPTFFGVLFLCLAGLIVLLCWPDMFVHGPVPPESVAGTYKR
jgi:drug/metabolite transporter (DMT)-like permease